MTKLEMMQLSQSLSDLYTGLETDLIANIAEYLAAGKIDSPTAQWKNTDACTAWRARQIKHKSYYRICWNRSGYADRGS